MPVSRIYTGTGNGSAIRVGLLGYLARGMEQPGLKHRPLKVAQGALLVPPTEPAAMRLITTSSHL